tara:strand:+ start:486 stop:851 length:366 start_codon:yes stop_codon:yes gene_type:complete
MKAAKQKKLEAAGWKVGSAVDFLELSDAEEMLVNMKLALAIEVKTRRKQLNITQQDLAKRIGSSQSRVAKIEIADRTVSLDLLVRSLASLGVSRSQIGKIVGTRKVGKMKTIPQKRLARQK